MDSHGVAVPLAQIVQNLAKTDRHMQGPAGTLQFMRVGPLQGRILWGLPSRPVKLYGGQQIGQILLN